MIDAVGNVPEDVLERLKILFTTPKGSVPLDRAFGIDQSFLDSPMNLARVRILDACVQAIRRYEPEYAVSDIHFTPGSGEDGSYKAEVIINYAD